MPETMTQPELRYVDYLDPEVARALPVPFPMWIAEESCRKVADVAAGLAPAEAEDLLQRAAAFLDEVLGMVKLDIAGLKAAHARTPRA